MMICCTRCGRWYDDAFPKCTNCGYSPFGVGGEVYNVPPPPPELSAMGGQFSQQPMAPPPNSNDINSPNYVPSMGVPTINDPMQQGYPIQQQAYPQQQGYPVPQQAYPQQQAYPAAQPNTVSMQQPFQAAVPQGKTKGPLMAVLFILAILIIGGIAVGIFVANRPAPSDVPESSTVSQAAVQETSPDNSTVPSDSDGQAATGGNR